MLLPARRSHVGTAAPLFLLLCATQLVPLRASKSCEDSDCEEGKSCNSLNVCACPKECEYETCGKRVNNKNHAPFKCIGACATASCATQGHEDEICSNTSHPNGTLIQPFPTLTGKHGKCCIVGCLHISCENTYDCKGECAMRTCPPNHFCAVKDGKDHGACCPAQCKDNPCDPEWKATCKSAGEECAVCEEATPGDGSGDGDGSSDGDVRPCSTDLAQDVAVAGGSSGAALFFFLLLALVALAGVWIIWWRKANHSDSGGGGRFSKLEQQIRDDVGGGAMKNSHMLSRMGKDENEDLGL